MMNYSTKILLVTIFVDIIVALPQNEDIFYAPDYEMGARIPPIPESGYVAPGVRATIRPIRYEPINSSSMVPADYVLGSNQGRPSSTKRLDSNFDPLNPRGTPWPAPTEEHANNVKKHSSGFIWPSLSDAELNYKYQDHHQHFVPPSIVLGYKPIMPSYQPNPGSGLPQSIPPGEPWPASAEGYEHLGSKSKPIRKSSTSKKPNISHATESSSIDEVRNKIGTHAILDYGPNKIGAHPTVDYRLSVNRMPGTIDHHVVIPTGRPWPSNQPYPPYTSNPNVLTYRGNNNGMEYHHPFNRLPEPISRYADSYGNYPPRAGSRKIVIKNGRITLDDSANLRPNKILMDYKPVPGSYDPSIPGPL